MKLVHVPMYVTACNDAPKTMQNQFEGIDICKRMILSEKKCDLIHDSHSEGQYYDRFFRRKEPLLL
jgi:hypothetical protein